MLGYYKRQLNFDKGEAEKSVESNLLAGPQEYLALGLWRPGSFVCLASRTQSHAPCSFGGAADPRHGLP